MTEERLENELRRTKQIAFVNGYTEQLVDDLINAHKQKRELTGTHNAKNAIKCKCCGKFFKEHRSHTNECEIRKSSVAKHIIAYGHNFDLSDFRLIRRVGNFYEFKTFESFYMHKIKNNLMNENEGPIKNSVFTKYFYY